MRHERATLKPATIRSVLGSAVPALFRIEFPISLQRLCVKAHPSKLSSAVLTTPEGSLSLASQRAKFRRPSLKFEVHPNIKMCLATCVQKGPYTGLTLSGPVPHAPSKLDITITRMNRASNRETDHGCHPHFRLDHSKQTLEPLLHRQGYFLSTVTIHDPAATLNQGS
jgi:ribosomal protein S10